MRIVLVSEKLRVDPEGLVGLVWVMLMQQTIERDSLFLVSKKICGCGWWQCANLKRVNNRSIYLLDTLIKSLRFSFDLLLIWKCLSVWPLDIWNQKLYICLAHSLWVWTIGFDSWSQIYQIKLILLLFIGAVFFFSFLLEQNIFSCRIEQNYFCILKQRECRPHQHDPSTQRDEIRNRNKCYKYFIYTFVKTFLDMMFKLPLL